MACEVLFTPLSTPRVDAGQTLVLSGSRAISIGSNGIGSILLGPGAYRVSFQGIPRNIDSIQIVTPDDALEYSLTSLISSGVVPQPQPLFNLMGFAVDGDGDLIPDAGLIPGGMFTIDADTDLIPA